MRDCQCVASPRLQKRAVLEQVRAVGLKRVARQPAFQLQVCQEVEHEVPE